MKNQQKAYLFALVAVFFWSTVATAFKLALQHLSFLQLLFVASWTSFLVLSIIIVATGRLTTLFSYSRKQYFQSLLLGTLNPALYYMVLLKAYSVLPAQEAMTLNYIWPLMLVVLSVPILGQKMSVKGIVALLISFSGIILIAMRNESGMYFSNLGGNALAVGSSVIWALFWLYNVRDKRDATVKLWFGFFFGAIIVSVITIGFDSLSFDKRGIWPAVYVGVFEMGLTFVFWLKAIQLTSRTEKVSQLIFLSPFLSLLWIQLIVGEKILVNTLAGLVLIIAGIVVQQGLWRIRPLQGRNLSVKKRNQ